MKYKININGKRHKVILAGDDYNINTTSVASGFTLTENSVDWSTAIGKVNLKDKLISFRGNQDDFSKIYKYFANIGAFSLTTGLSICISTPTNTLVLTGNEGSVCEIYDYHQSMYGNGLIWKCSENGEVIADNKIKLDSSIGTGSLVITDISVTFAQHGTSNYYNSVKDFIDSWLNEHLIVE